MTTNDSQNSETSSHEAAPGTSILSGAVIDNRAHNHGIEIPGPSLTINGDYCSIMTYKLEPTLPLGIGVDKIYRTGPTTLIELFFHTNPKVYEKEIKKTSAEQQQDQERIDDIQAFLFNYTNVDRYHGCSTMLHWERDISLKKVKDPLDRVLYDKIISGYDQLISDLNALQKIEEEAGVRMEWGLVKK